jgi:hypothetical protein
MTMDKGDFLFRISHRLVPAGPFIQAVTRRLIS